MDGAARAVARVVQVRTGAVGVLDRAAVGREGTVPSALGKRPRGDAVELGPLGFDGDAQADTAHHGGPQKAALVFAEEHYPRWRDELGRDLAGRGLGENLRVRGEGGPWDERAVRPGDVYRIGTALVRVTAPRRPCYKLGLAHGVPDMPVRVQRAGRTGFYLAVLEPGAVRAGDAVTTVRRAAHAVTAFEVNRVLNVDKGDADGIRHVLTAADDLPSRWVDTLRARLAGAAGAGSGNGDDDARLYG